MSSSWTGCVSLSATADLRLRQIGKCLNRAKTHYSPLRVIGLFIDSEAITDLRLEHAQLLLI